MISISTDYRAQKIIVRSNLATSEKKCKISNVLDRVAKNNVFNRILLERRFYNRSGSWNVPVIWIWNPRFTDDISLRSENVFRLVTKNPHLLKKTAPRPKTREGKWQSPTNHVATIYYHILHSILYTARHVTYSHGQQFI